MDMRSTADELCQVVHFRCFLNASRIQVPMRAENGRLNEKEKLIKDIDKVLT